MKQFFLTLVGVDVTVYGNDSVSRGSQQLMSGSKLGRRERLDQIFRAERVKAVSALPVQLRAPLFERMGEQVVSLLRDGGQLGFTLPVYFAFIEGRGKEQVE